MEEYSSKLQQIIRENEASSEAYINSLLVSHHKQDDFSYLYSQTMLLRVIDMKLKELLFRVNDEDFYTVASSNYTDVVNAVTSSRRNRLFCDLPHSAKAAAFYRVFSEPILQEVIEGVEMIKEIKRMEKDSWIVC